MKNTILTFILGAAAVFSAGAQRQPVPRINGGVAPVEAVSMNFRSLPENAQTFVNELFPTTMVASVTNDVADREYEVKMSDGYEITFDYNGNWLEVETPDNVMLPSSVLNKLVPENVVVETLTGDAVVPGGVVNFIESVEYVPDYGYVVKYESTTSKGKVGIDKTGNILKNKPDKVKKSDKMTKVRKGDKDKKACCCKAKTGKKHSGKKGKRK